MFTRVHTFVGTRVLVAPQCQRRLFVIVDLV